MIKSLNRTLILLPTNLRQRKEFGVSIISFKVKKIMESVKAMYNKRTGKCNIMYISEQGNVISNKHNDIKDMFWKTFLFLSTKTMTVAVKILDSFEFSSLYIGQIGTV